MRSADKIMNVLMLVHDVIFDLTTVLTLKDAFKVTAVMFDEMLGSKMRADVKTDVKPNAKPNVKTEILKKDVNVKNVAKVNEISESIHAEKTEPWNEWTANQFGNQMKIVKNEMLTNVAMNEMLTNVGRNEVLTNVVKNVILTNVETSVNHQFNSQDESLLQPNQRSWQLKNLHSFHLNLAGSWFNLLFLAQLFFTLSRRTTQSNQRGENLLILKIFILLQFF